MSPSKFQDSEVTKGVINGPRPSPLKIYKDSHGIHKPSLSSPSSSSNPSVVENFGGHPSAAKSHKQRPPVIIYTHSPKVIHAQARDFMALVQKLTGMERSSDEKTAKPELSESVKDDGCSFSEEKDKNVNGFGRDNESSSVLMDEKFGGDVKKHDSSAVSLMYKVSNPYLADPPPLFTPNSNEFFCSSRPNSLFQYPTMANSISPSYMEYMKGFPEL